MNSVVAKYRDACLRVGSRMGVSIVDVYAALGSGNQEQVFCVSFTLFLAKYCSFRVDRL